jgi:hypothetical protein
VWRNPLALAFLVVIPAGDLLLSLPDLLFLHPSTEARWPIHARTTNPAGGPSFAVSSQRVGYSPRANRFHPTQLRNVVISTEATDGPIVCCTAEKRPHFVVAFAVVAVALLLSRCCCRVVVVAVAVAVAFSRRFAVAFAVAVPFLLFLR